jgi:hypothetical protein
MPRIARIDAPFSVRHIIFRFVNGENRFDQVPDARREFLRRLGVTLVKADWIFLAFGLMGSHGHLVFLAGNAPPSKIMRPLESGFACWWNSKMRKRGYPYSRTRGPVFADRFADIIIPPERTAVVIAYVHNNPVRARVVISPEISCWTSHRAFLGLDAPLPHLNSKRALNLCGLDDTERGRTEFHDFVLSRINDPKDSSLSNEYALEQRQHIRAALKLPAELATGHAGVQSVQFDILPQSLAAQTARYNGSPEVVLQKVAEVIGIMPQQRRIALSVSRFIARARRRRTYLGRGWPTNRANRSYPRNLRSSGFLLVTKAGRLVPDTATCKNSPVTVKLFAFFGSVPAK